MPVSMPWIRTGCMVIIAVVGWAKVIELELALQAKDESVVNEVSERSSIIQAQESGEELRQQVLSAPEELEEVSSAISIEQSLSPTEIQACLDHPQIQKLITDKAEQLSTVVVNEKVMSIWTKFMIHMMMERHCSVMPSIDMLKSIRLKIW